MAGKHFGRQIEPTSMAETMVQVSMQSTHHRGQVASHLRGLGITPPLTDFIAWVWLGKAAPEWPSSLDAPAAR